MDRIGVIKAAANNLGDLIVDSTPASLTGSSIDLLELIHPESQQLKGKTAYLYGSGAAAGQERTITDFLPANDRMVTRGFDTTPSLNTNVAVFDFFQKAKDYDAALNRMIGQARLRYLEDMVATIQLVGSQYEYAVPSGFEYISNLRLVPSGHSDYEEDTEVDRIFELPPRFWNIEMNPGGTYLIALDPRKISIDANLDEQWVRIMGQSRPDIAATDNATIPGDLEEYLIDGVSMLLASRRIRENEEWRDKFQIFRDSTRDLVDYVHRNRYGRRVRG